MKKFGVLLIAVLLAAASVQASYTVATFANPSSGSSDPLFWVDWTGGTIHGGWDTGGLVLDFKYVGASFDARFEMDSVDIVEQDVFFGNTIGLTGEGVINFYNEATDELLLSIAFSRAIVDAGGFWSHNAVFSSPLISDLLSDEQFSFGFANNVSFGGGFSATAAFDSSAIPEPATLAIFGIGAAMMFRLRKRA